MAKFLIFMSVLLMGVMPLAYAQTQTTTDTQKDGRVYVVTYFEVVPAGQPGPAGPTPAEIFSRYARDAVKEPGAISFDTVKDVGMGNHYIVLEVWASHDAFLAHGAADAAHQLAKDLGPWLLGVSDQRVQAQFK
jgi:quinol monooxygenase YgiN